MERGEAFRAAITESGAEVVLLELAGELDPATRPQFEAALGAVLASEPKRIVFDLSAATFVDAAAYDAIGGCRKRVEELVICSKNSTAQRVLGILGYEDVVFISMDVPGEFLHLERR